MPSIAVMGAGPSGLGAAMLFADCGADVTVFDKDPTEPPSAVDSVWDQWNRPGVAQFRQAHTIISRGRSILENKLPSVLDHLIDLGGHEVASLDDHPPTIKDWTPDPDDARFRLVGARRPIYEMAFVLGARESANVDIRRGVGVTGLMTGPEADTGVPHITGVETATGETIRADLVVDAAGRRSNLPVLLESAGARRPSETSEDSKFAYYTRFYRKKDDGDFPPPYVPSLFPVGSISVLTLPGDNDTWSVTLYSTTSDKAMRAVRDPAAFERVLGAIAPRSHWIEGEPITDVHVMAGISDRTRSLMIDNQPVATGVVSVADAWACTNPSLGRGITMALMHIEALIPELAVFLDRPAELSGAYHRITNEELLPWHDQTLAIDRSRNAAMDRARLGLESEKMPPSTQAFIHGMATDQTIFRAGAEINALFSLASEVFARPDVVSRLTTIAEDLPDDSGSEILPRSELEALLG